MKKVLTHIAHLWTLAIALSMCVSPSFGKLAEINALELKEVMKIARAINVVQPFLEEGKYLDYAWGIFRASQRYRIEPEVLIAITEQETNFREDLPEGAAGERGICQIRKNWLKNKKFRKEFNRATVKDLHRPSKSFMFAAWILKGLKTQSMSTTLPYWSYYNSVRFENRMKYFLAVNRSISALKKYEGYINSEVASSDAPKPPPLSDYKQTTLAFYKPAQPNQLYRSPTSQSLSADTPVVSAPPPVKRLNRVAEVTEKSGRWISDALQKIQEQARIKDNGSSEGKKIVPTSIMRTAQELGVTNFYSAASVQD